MTGSCNGFNHAKYACGSRKTSDVPRLEFMYFLCECCGMAQVDLFQAFCRNPFRGGESLQLQTYVKFEIAYQIIAECVYTPNYSTAKDQMAVMSSPKPFLYQHILQDMPPGQDEELPGM